MSESEKPVTACLIIIGNEILSGRTIDANLPYIAQKLGASGIRMAEVRVVADDEAAIVEAVNACRERYGYVFTTGGIGPTHDDITAASIAKAFGRPYGRNAEAERRLLAYYPPERVNAARMKMADTPEGAELIDNPVSVAPGFRIANVYVLPGVPKIMQAMACCRRFKAGRRCSRARSRSTPPRATSRTPGWATSRPGSPRSRSAATRSSGRRDRAPRSCFAAPIRARSTRPPTPSSASPPGSARRPGRTLRPRMRETARAGQRDLWPQSTTCQLPSGWRQAVP
jgi:molybdenum cofactor synthesis domain-containing protein